MNDTIKMFFISLLTALLVQILLGPQLFKYYQANSPAEQAIPSQPAALPQQTASQVEHTSLPTSSDTQTSSLQAPDFRGLSLSKAQSLAQSQGITIIEDGQQAAPEKQVGEILQQIPPPGSLLTDRTLRVVVAQAPAEVTMPAVINKPSEEARNLLKQAGFRTIKTTDKSANKTPGTVLQQVPQAGEKVPVTTEIVLEIAAPPMIDVPKLTGKYLHQAKAILKQAGLKVGSVTYQEHEEYGQNFVLRQEPAEGSKVPEGTEINVVVVAPN